MERVRFTLSPYLVELLDEQARLNGKSRSTWMRAVLVEALDREEAKAQASDRD